MAQEQPKKYYRPYTSDSEDSDSDTSGSDTASELDFVSDQPNYRRFASELQLNSAAGPNLTPDEQIVLEYSEHMAPYHTDVSGVNIPKIKATKKDVTSVIMLDSRDRDKSIFTQPTFLTLRLPRIYRNISNFQILQVSLLSSFYYFRADKNNLTITIQEYGRIEQDKYSVIKTSGAPLTLTKTLREGTYNIDTLIAEINLQLNATPIFFDYRNGFTDFAIAFATTGDYSLNFNEAGDYFYDALNNLYIRNPDLVKDIVPKYFQTTYAGLTSYSVEQIKVAYYYPVLKEILLDVDYGIKAVDLDITDLTELNYDRTTINITDPTQSNYSLETRKTLIFDRCIYTFTGLDDRIVQQVIDKNINIISDESVLDTYRLKHTFRYALINEYNVSYAANNNRITITSSGLNTSLKTLLTNQYNDFFANQLTVNNLTVAQYNSLSVTNKLYLAVITDMYSYLQKYLAFYFGINFNTFSIDYYINSGNELPLQDATNSTGVSSNYDTNVIFRNITSINSNILNTFHTAPPVYWPSLTTLSINTASYYSGNSYNLIVDSNDSKHSFTDGSGMVYQNPLFKSANFITNINAEQYTVFTFRSYTRQTLRVTALPRPMKYRYPAYNDANYDTSYQAVFDNSYSFIDNTNFDTTPIVTKIPQIKFGATLSTVVTANSTVWTAPITLDINTNRTFFSFTAPAYPSPVSGNVYKYSMNIGAIPVAGNAFTTPIKLFLYHDRSAFMADIYDTRNEKPIHYIANTPVASSNYTSSILNFNVYAGHTYYLIVRYDSNLTGINQFYPTPFFSPITTSTIMTTSLSGFNPLGSNLSNFNYASVSDPDFIRLPTSSNLYSSNLNGYDSNFSAFTDNYVPMGYDSNGISTDLTDYIGYLRDNPTDFVPTSPLRIDPISGYIFQSGGGYDATKQSYLTFPTAYGNSNQLLLSNATNFPGAITIAPPSRQFVIAHWYKQIFIPNSANQVYVNPNSYVTSYTKNFISGIPDNLYSYPYTQDIVYPNIYSIPQTNASLLKGYTFNNNAISLGNGILGISIIPTDGIWDVNKIMFRSSYIDSNDDTNRNIKYLGIFPASYINTLAPSEINLSNSLMQFQISSIITYGPGNTQNAGFESMVGGTYYEWVNMSTTKYLNGYAQTPGKIITDSNAYYSIIPFTSNLAVTTYSLISGSIVPYPTYSDASASQLYLDGTSTPTGTYVINPIKKTNPSYTPSGDPSQSQYEQSIPIGSTLLQYIQPNNLSADASGCKPFDISGQLPPIRGIRGATPIQAPCFRVANYALFSEGGSYVIYYYPPNTPKHIFSLVNTITPDIFFTNFTNTQLVAISGNNSVFAFLGLSATALNTGFAYTLIIETYNPNLQSGGTVDTIILNNTRTDASGVLGTASNALFQALNGITVPVSAGYADGARAAFVMSPSSIPSFLVGANFYINGGLGGTYVVGNTVPTTTSFAVTSITTDSPTNATRTTYSVASTTGVIVGGYLTISGSFSTGFNGNFICNTITSTTFSVLNKSAGATLVSNGITQQITAYTIVGTLIKYSILSFAGFNTSCTISGLVNTTLNGTYTGILTGSDNGNYITVAPIVTYSVGTQQVVTYAITGTSIQYAYKVTPLVSLGTSVTISQMILNPVLNGTFIVTSVPADSNLQHYFTITSSVILASSAVSATSTTSAKITFSLGSTVGYAVNQTILASGFSSGSGINGIYTVASISPGNTIVCNTTQFATAPPSSTGTISIIVSITDYSLSGTDIRFTYAGIIPTSTITGTSITFFNIITNTWLNTTYTLSKIDTTNKILTVGATAIVSLINYPSILGYVINGSTITYQISSTAGFNLGGAVTIQYPTIPSLIGTYTISNVQQVLQSDGITNFYYFDVAATAIVGINKSSIKSYNINGTSITFTVSSLTGFINGATVKIQHPTLPSINGSFTITNINSSLNAFTILNPSYVEIYITQAQQTFNPTIPTITAPAASVTVTATASVTQSPCLIATTTNVGSSTGGTATIAPEIMNVDSFNYNDSLGYTFGITYGIWNTVLAIYQNIQYFGAAKGTPTNDTSQPVFLITNLGGLSGLSPTYEILQAPYEPLGKFFIAAKTAFATSGSYQKPTASYTIREPMLVNNVVLQANLTNYAQNGLFLVSPIDTPTTTLTLSNINAPYVYYASNANIVPAITRLNLFTDDSSPSAFGYITILQNPIENKLTLAYDMYNMTRAYYELVSFSATPIGNTSNTTFSRTLQSFTSYDGTAITPYQVLGGGGGSFWLLFNEANNTTTQTLKYDSIWGNRGDAYDFHIGISNAYQIFYPTQRIVMTKVARSYNPITDISGTPEFPHTSIFAYDSLSSFVTDISSNKWGLESNFLTADTSLKSGFYFGACDLNIPLNSNSTPYYIALRNYTPTEKSQVMLRFSLPNRYDFGYVTIKDLSNEIVLSQTRPALFNSNYANIINQFNSNFIFTSSTSHLFGSNIVPGYAGSNYSNVQGFGDFITQFTNLYTTYNSNVKTFTNINLGTQSNMQNFINSNLAAIIPVNTINRQRYTDPIIYSILWRSSLPSQYVKQENNWGLGWNLGFDKQDTSYLTTHVGTSFYKILDDYINLKLNSEYNMNNIDTGSKENLQVSQDTTGSIKSYYGKLLLNSFGSFSQTMISNPIVYQTPIPKIDRLTFTWFDNTGTTINNNDCEWTMVVQLVESLDIVTNE
jgi:hypothetical protein